MEVPAELGSSDEWPKTTCVVGSRNYTCPVCGWQCNGFDEGLRVSMAQMKGIYCLQCYCKWIDANIPKMVEDNKQ